MLNRYFARTLVKGATIAKTFNRSVLLAPATQNLQLVRISKMNFFDYDNKDKNLFTSDEEEGSYRNQSQDSFGGSGGFFNNDFDSKVHRGKFEVEDIPLYINKMRNEIRDFRRREFDGEHYINKFRNFVSMHYQNKDRIFAEFPRSSSIFYEYAAFRNENREKSFLESLEDHIISANLHSMPIPGIKNMLRASLQLRRSRDSFIEGIGAHLNDRAAYNDVSSNINILESLVSLRK